MFIDEQGEPTRLDHQLVLPLGWGLIMTHADDNGLVLPPALAPAHVVLLPITMKAKDPKAVLAHCQKIAEELRRAAHSWGGPSKLKLMDLTSGVATKQ